MKTYLQVKIISLADEARTIRRKERATKRNHARLKALGKVDPTSEPPKVYFGLRDHRRRVVRPEIRASLIAYGFLRGRPYAAIEGPTTRTPPDWAKVHGIVDRFVPADQREGWESRLKEWSAPPAAPVAQAA